MALIGLHALTMAFGGEALLDGVNLQIEEGDRLCLMGRNGTGKSTLLKIIAGQLQHDGGELQRQRGLTVASVTQEVPVDLEGTVFSIVAGGLGDTAAQLARYHELGIALSTAEPGPTQEALLSELESLQHALESGDGFRLHRMVEQILSRLQLDPDLLFETLSGGIKRRVLLAKALVSSPDVLLLDEPTNHLDIETILWLEGELRRSIKTLIFVTHDRAFARDMANRVAELDRGQLIHFRCGYDEFIEKRVALLEDERTKRALFDKKLAQEESWIRQGIEARRTRNEGRVRALKKLREEYRLRRSEQGKASFQLQQAGRSGALVAEVEKVAFAYPGEERSILRDFSFRIQRGDRVGIIGPNGSGKTTLLKILLGDLQPQSGEVKLGTRRELCYLDQLRGKLDLEKTVQENVGEGRDTLMINGEAKHVLGYLQEFLFSPSRSRSPARVLSGGERNRLLLAKLFTQPFNLLVMDEPTNDLDVETLDLLEELLLQYKGTLLLVSHDRAFLNNVVTATLNFEGDGLVREYAGGYDDAMQQRAEGIAAQEAKPTHAGSGNKNKDQRAGARGATEGKAAPPKKKKMSFKEKREFEGLPEKIAALEGEQSALHEAVSDPMFYKKAATEAEQISARLASLEKEIGHAYERWAQLEEMEG